MSKVLTLLALTLVGCETTGYDISPEEIATIEDCSNGDSDACVQAARDAARVREYVSAENFAAEACDMGNRDGCQLHRNLIRLAESKARWRQANPPPPSPMGTLVNGLGNAAQQAGRITPTPAYEYTPPQRTRTRCVQKWNAIFQQYETVCTEE